MRDKTTLLILIGPSASGKSTFTDSIVSPESNWIISSRDSIRKSLFGYEDSNLFIHYGSKMFNQREKMVTYLSEEIIAIAVVTSQNVVVDNTHLSMKYITELLEKWDNGNFDIKFKIFNTDMETCINRDRDREAQVGRQIIEKQFKQFQSLINNPVFKTITDNRIYND